MRRTKAEAERTKQDLLTAGLHVFGRKGYAATRVEEIADQANVTTGALYHHFGGKSDLYTALVNQSAAKANQLAREAIEEGGTPKTMLRRLLVQLFANFEEDPQYRAVVELAVNKTEMVPELAGLHEQIIESRRLMIGFFTTVIEKGIAAGEFRPSLSADDAALALSAYINGIGLIWIQDQELFSIGKRAEKLIDLILGGLSA